MKKILLVLTMVLTVFTCQYEPIDVPIESSIIANQTVNKDGVIVETTYDDFSTQTQARTSSAQAESSATISPTITVGTGKELVTITGSGFGIEKGLVNWYGYYKSSRWQIKSWTDTKIEVWVPAGAYSGPVDILAPDNATILGTTNSLTVKYGVYPATAGNDESTWRYERLSFIDTEIVWHAKTGTDQTLKDRFDQALAEWKCKSGVNWSRGVDVDTDPNSSASLGSYVFGRGPSPGAAHNSMAYLNCGDDTFYTMGGRIVFDERDDYTAALHELGHAAGLPHSNNSGSCMVSSGGKNVSTWDAEGALDKVNWSVNNPVSCQPVFVKAGCAPLLTYYQDLDGDGYGNSSVSVQAETQPDGYVSTGGDCNDNDPTINPGATEILDNAIDEDCDGVANQSPTYTFYEDADGDGYGNPDISITLTDNTAPNGYVRNNRDCNDSDASINPAAEEILDNNVDEDCDGIAQQTSDYANGIDVPSTFSGSKLKVNITGNFAINKVEAWVNGQKETTQTGRETGMFFINLSRQAPNGLYTFKFFVESSSIVVEKQSTKESKGGGNGHGPKR